MQENTPPNAIEANDASAIGMINKLLLEAINLRASDLHFECYEKIFRIRFRIDGILYEHLTPAIHLAARFIARLKVMAKLDIAERRTPQDGRFKLMVSGDRFMDFRVNTCPTLFGEKAVVRVLDPLSAVIGMDALGYEENQKELFLKAIHQRQGMVLITGPTGSGKTISLYAALQCLNTMERNISSCEDPVEINLPGINQVSVNLKTGLTFAKALRAFLRQDPDIIMIGEIRDLETAEIAVKASETGHLILSTLHTNSAVDTLTRLMHMGIPAYHLATSLSLIISARLARRLCQFCKIPYKHDIHELTLFRSGNCKQCKNGYLGRIGIFEVMPISNEMQSMILKNCHTLDIHRQALKEGLCDIKQAALHKVKQGLTSLEEINSIL